MRVVHAIFALALALAATPGLAGPVALVTELSGELSPAVGLFDEVEAGTRLTLGAAPA